MGTVLELRPRAANDWTLFERGQLETLVDQLPALSARDLVYGVTDEGDPWCVVMDDDGEVVLHVARIGGRYFVHAATDNVVSEARDLTTAVARLAGDDTASRRQPSVAQLPLAQTLPAYTFGALGEAQALPVERLAARDDAVAAEPAPAVASMASVSDLPAYDAAAIHFTFDPSPLELTVLEPAVLSTADPTAEAAVRSSLMTSGAAPLAAPAAPAVESIAAAAAMQAVPASIGPEVRTQTAQADAPAPPAEAPREDGGVVVNLFPATSSTAFGLSGEAAPALPPPLLTGQQDLRAAAMEAPEPLPDGLYLTGFDGPGVVMLFWPPPGSLVGVSVAAEAF